MALRARFHWGTALIVVGGLLLGLAAGLLIFRDAPVSQAVPVVSPQPTLRAAVASETLPAPAPAPVAGAPAPDFTLADLSGAQVSLSDLKGKVVLLNFWATWCPPCKLEMPTLQQHYTDYKDQGLVVVGVEAGEPRAEVQAFADQQRLTFPILPDEKSSVTDLYRVLALPTTFVIDREGMIVRQHRGMMSEAQVDGYLAALGLKKP